MGDVVIKVENLCKEYRLGVISHRTLAKDLQSWWSRVRGQEDPNVPLEAEGDACGKVERFMALRDVSFEVNRGDIVGIIGRNGAGKSTLLKILSRVTGPSSGEVRYRGRIASLLEVGTGFNPELTGRENIFLNGAILGMRKAEIRKKLDEIIDFAEVERFIDTPVKRYSSGMYIRLAFAVAAHLEPDILIVDEVLAVGDAQFQKKCLGKMEDAGKEGRTVLFVSHNMGVVAQLCRTGILLHAGSISCEGNVLDVVHNYSLSQKRGCGFLPGQLFKLEDDNICEEQFQVTEILLLDRDSNRKAIVKTWDDVKFRITFHAPHKVPSGSVVIRITTSLGYKVIEMSTRPLSGLDVSFERGDGSIDCFIPRIPLSAGSYKISVLLAVPRVKWLFTGEDICDLNVLENDIYCSGLPPKVDRTVFALEHSWSRG